MLTPTYVISSNIDALAHYDGKLYIRFKSGITYSYANVPFTYFDAMQKAESAGQFFHRMIKNKPEFPYTKLDYDPFREPVKAAAAALAA